jgi:hypothetical protein
MTTLTCPVVGYLFPAARDEDWDAQIEEIIYELAEMEAAPGTEEFADAIHGYRCLTDAEVAAIYADRSQAVYEPIDYDEAW